MYSDEINGDGERFVVFVTLRLDQTAQDSPEYSLRSENPNKIKTRYGNKILKKQNIQIVQL